MLTVLVVFFNVTRHAVNVTYPSAAIDIAIRLW
jgi:hypothetical protein